MIIMKKTRNTLQKTIIFKTVQEMKNHPTAEQIYLKINKKYPNISKGTVYRNLNLLVSNGQINRVSLAGEADRFDFRIDHHHHLKCEMCQKVTDVEVEGENIFQYIKNRENILINSYEITFKGICNNCLHNSIKEEK